MVVSAASPLNYLVLIEQINILPTLYGRVLIPQSIYEGLGAPETPERLVQSFASIILPPCPVLWSLANRLNDTYLHCGTSRPMTPP